MNVATRSYPTAYALSIALFAVSVLLLLMAIPASSQPAPPPSYQAVADSSDGNAPDAESDPKPWERRIGSVYPGRVVRTHGGDYVGNAESWPYRSTAIVDRDAPPIRYNRVEGLTIGVQRNSLDLESNDRARVFGQFGFATELNRIRATGGTEFRVYSAPRHALKFGVKGYYNTFTEDAWKTSYLENSLAGLIFGHDFFNYYQARGASVYAVQHIAQSVRLSAGVQTELQSPLRTRTTWSIFDGDGFSANPRAEAGRSTAAVFALDAGHIRDFDGLPTGGALRVSAEIGHGLSGQDDWLDSSPTEDLQYNRYTADGRVYLPTSYDTRLALRLRGGYATSDAPAQKLFYLGGIGSMRGYGQNSVIGTKSLLANAEFIIDGATLVDDILDDLYVAIHGDAGWVGQPGEAFDMNDVLPSAGFGIGLGDRAVRLDVTWPLRDVPEANSGPSIWLRITPHF
ncbi:hypothetical protein CRI94_04710 [Longibacter salinarum]|uniref:Haemolysin activator HlyB C-terminal domain-containing protein n=1 Tax=Longibacter salinarum TaxID=1850348 RepID=A0A2A8D0E8_9BACT|nr:DUF5686 family protein [Longibacter salinarum]PEN14340.1 hypothetical protein CRI94_04710 [Longibacter salinarum]